MTYRFALSTTALVTVALLAVSGALAQEKPTPEVLIYSTYFVADGMRFGSIQELRAYLLAATNEFAELSLRDCAAKDLVEEVERMMNEVITERAARRNQPHYNYIFGIGSPPECPWKRGTR